MVLPNTVISIDFQAFAYSQNLTGVELSSNLISIGYDAFRYCSSLADITLPLSLTSIGEKAFEACAIESLHIPHHQVSIGGYAFSLCSELKNVTLPQTWDHIPDGIFQACGSLTHIDLPHGIQSIGRNAFNYTGLERIEIPDNVKEIGSHAFYECYNLDEVSFPEGLETIGWSAFQGNKELESVVLPDSLQSIDNQAFASCKELKHLSFGENLESIGEEAFLSCSKLTEINIPSKVSSIGEAAFGDCGNLENFSVAQENSHYSSLEGVLFNKAKTLLIQYPAWKTDDSQNLIRAYSIPETVNRIGRRAFAGCRLKSIELPDQLETIEERAFYGATSLEHIVFPNGLRSIGKNAFYATMLKEVTFPGSLKSLGEGAFAPFGSAIHLLWAKFEGNAPEDVGSNVFGSPPRYVHPDFVIYYNRGASGFTDPWNGYTTEAVGPEPGDYYASPLEKYFRIVDPTNTAYPRPSAFNIQVNQANYNTGSADHAVIEIQDTYRGSVAVSKTGYHPYELPNRFIAGYNWIALYPDSVQKPFVQAALVDKSSSSFKSFTNVLIDGEMIYENSLTVTRLYIDVNWNGESPGSVYLKQGKTRVDLSEGDNELTLGTSLSVEGGHVHLCMETGTGKVYSQKLKINVYERMETVRLDFGSSTEVDIPDEVAVIGGRKLKLDLSDFSDGLLPLEFEVDSDGTFKGTFGLRFADPKKKGYAFGKLKDAIGVLNSDASSDKQVSDAIKSLLKDQYFSPVDNYASFGVGVKVQLLCCFEGSLSKGEKLFTSIDSVFIAKGSVSGTQVFFVAGVPFYFEAGLKASIQTTLSMVYNEQVDYFRPADVGYKAKLHLYGGTGIGAPGIVSGGVRMTGGVTMDATWPYDSNNAAWYLDGKVSLMSTFIGMETDYEILKSGKLYIWKDGEAFPYDYHFQDNKQTLNLVEAMKWTPVPRDYSNVDSLFRANDPALIPLALGKGRQNSTAFKTNTYRYPDPQYLLLEDGTELAVWVDDDRERPVDENRTALYYSVNQDGFWSEPAMVWQDGTADFNPALRQVDDQAFLVWINADREFTAGETIQEMAAATVIACARFDAEAATFVGAANAGDLEGLNMLADLTLVDGEPTLVWVNNSAADPFGSQGVTSIWSAVWRESDWQAEEMASDLGAIDGLSAACDGTALEVWFSQDMDGDPLTLEDREIFQLRQQNLTQHTNNQVTDTKPQYADDLYWFSDGSIVSAGAEAGIPAMTDRFQVCISPAGLKAITYLAAGEEDLPAIYAVYDDGSGWGEPRPVLETEGYIVNYSAAFRPDGSLSLLVNEQSLGEEGEVLQSDLVFYSLPATTDVAVTHASYDAYSLIPGHGLDVCLELDNIGTSQVSELHIVFRAGESDLDTVIAPFHLASGQQDVLWLSCQLPDQIDFDEISITVTPSQLEDDDLSNNTMTMPLRLVDISVEEVDAFSYGSHTVVTACVINRGQTALSDIRVDLYADEESGSPLAFRTITALDKNDLAIVEFTTDLLEEGNLVYVVASELDEENILANNRGMAAVILLEAAEIMVTEPEPVPEFSDVSEAHWAFVHIRNLVAMGIVSGYAGTNEFRPNNKINRQEVSKMIAISAGLTVSEGFISELSDLSQASPWAHEFILALEEAGVVSGFGKTNEFRARINIKRSHASKMIVLAFGLAEGNVPVTLTDIGGVDCEEYIRILASNGIVSGYAGTSLFKPDNEISRAEFAKIIDLAWQLSPMH